MFIFWLGWFGFNGSSQSALAGANGAAAISNILVNTNLAAAHPRARRSACEPERHYRRTGGEHGGAGHRRSLLGCRHRHGRRRQCVAGLKLLERFEIDDFVGAILAHLFAGVWGTLAYCIATVEICWYKLSELRPSGAFVFGAPWLTWSVTKWTIGVCTTLVFERSGQDVAELGIDASLEFVVVPDADDLGLSSLPKPGGTVCGRLPDGHGV